MPIIGVIMKIKDVRLYQAVRLDGKSETHFQVAKQESEAKQLGKTCYKAEQTEHGILFTGDNEAVLASWNNVAYVTYELPKQEAPKKAAK